MSLLDTTTSLRDAYGRITQQRAWLKNVVLPAAATLFAGASNINQIFQFVDNIRAAQGVISAAVSSVSAAALKSYAETELNSTTYDPGSDYKSLDADLTAIISWVTTNVGLSAAYVWNAAVPGERTPASFTAAQTAGLVTAINAAITQLS